MTPAATPEALAEALARELARLDGWQDPNALWTDNLGIIARGGEGAPVYLDYVEDAGKLIAGPLVPFLAALQRVTAERDEARAKQRDMHRRAQKAESFRERHRGGFNYLMNGKRKERFGRRAAEAALATATAEAASLRAENEKLKQENADTRTELDALIQEVMRNG